MSLIIQAAQFAAEKHRGQKRDYTNRPYITHPIRVAGRVATHPRASEELVAAAFLHDVVEDCGVTIHELQQRFISPVSYYVECLTNNSKQSGKSRAERKKMDRERLRTIPDVVKIVKLIDRIDNLNELDLSDDFATLYAEESLLLCEVLEDADMELGRELRQICEGILSEK